MRKLLIIAFIIFSIFYTKTVYASVGYHFLFEPSNQFSSVVSALPNNFFVVSDDNNDVGICDENGRLVTQMEYTSISQKDGQVIGNYNGKNTLIALPSGQKLLEYDALDSFYKNGEYIVAEKNGLKGVVNRTNEQILQFAYDYITYLGNDRFLVLKDGKRSVVTPGDQTAAGPLQNLSITLKYPDYDDFSADNLLCASTGDGYGLVDKNLQPVLPFTHNIVQLQPVTYSNEIFIEGIKAGGSTVYSLIDQTGKELIPNKYDNLSEIGVNLFLGMTNTQTDVIDQTGKVLFSNTAGGYVECCYFADDFMSVMRGYYQDNPDGRLPELYVKEKNIRPVLRITDGNGKVGLYTVNGDTILPNEYDYLYSAMDSNILDPDAIIGKKDGSVGLLNESGDTVIPFDYDGLDINFTAPNNFNRAEYIETLKIKDTLYTVGAVNMQNERVDDDFSFSVYNDPSTIVLADQFTPHSKEGAMGGISWLNVYNTFSPVNGLYNGHSFSYFKSIPESPVLSFAYQTPVIIDTINNRLMYPVTYQGRGSLIVFDGFLQATAPMLDGWVRNIQFTVGETAWSFNGAQIENDVAPFISADNRTLVPVRVIAESVGAEVTWDNYEKADYIAKDGVTLKLTVGEQLPDNMGAAILVDDRLFVPVRYIAENFDGTVTWDAETKTVGITLGGTGASAFTQNAETYNEPPDNHATDFSDNYAEVVAPYYQQASDFSENMGMVMFNGKYGFVDTTGKEVIQTKYDDASFFSEGLARVELANKWGYIDKTGKAVVPFQYDNAGDFSDGMAAVALAGKMGFIDNTGKVVVPIQYDLWNTFYLTSFSEDMAMVTLNGKYGYVDKTGKEVIPVQYNDARDFSDGLALVINSDGQWSFIDKTGKEIIKVSNDILAPGSFVDGVAPVWGSGFKYGLMDKTGKLIIPCKYDNIGPFSDGLAMVMIDGKCGYIDTTGAEVVPVKYAGGSDFSEGLAAVYLDGRNRYVDTTGKEVLVLNYDGAYSFSDGVAAVTLNGKLGFIDKTGKEVVPIKYDLVREYQTWMPHFSDNMAPVEFNGIWGYVGYKG